MKKILTASTALVAAGMITAGAADAADKIKINVGGFSQWWVVGVWQDTKFQNAGTATIPTPNNNIAITTNPSAAAGQRANVDVKGNNEIWFSGDTTLDNGMKVGVFVGLEAGGHSDIQTDVIDKSYAWVEGGFGKVMLGTAANGTALLHVQAPDAANNFTNGGVMMANFAVSKPSAVMGMNQIVGSSGSMNTTNIIADDNAEKVTYVAPSFAGLTVGATYIPNVARQDARGTPLSRSEAFGGGAMYANTFGPVGVKLSGGYVWVDLTSTGGLDRAYAAHSYGTQLSYAGFTLGGSVQLAREDHKNGALTSSVLGSTTTVGAGGPSANVAYVAPAKAGTTGIDFGGKAFDVGLQYASGPYAVSLAYFRSEVNGVIGTYGSRKDLIEFYQASGKYALGPGVDMLASVGYAHYKDQRKGQTTISGLTASQDQGLENSGWTAMSGLSLAF